MKTEWGTVWYKALQPVSAKTAASTDHRLLYSLLTDQVTDQVDAKLGQGVWETLSNSIEGLGDRLPDA